MLHQKGGGADVFAHVFYAQGTKNGEAMASSPATLLPVPLICIIAQTAHSEVLSVAIWVTVEPFNVDMLDKYEVS